MGERMAGNETKGIKEEVDSRLGELFGDKPSSAEPREKAESDPAGPAEFKELKALMLSVEWEITDDSMVRFLTETERLQGIYQDDPMVLSFLKLLGSVGKYIGNKKSQAHPNSITLLHSIYNKFETVLTASEMTDAEIKKILSEEIKKFKLLREKLVGQTALAPPKDAPAPGERKRPSDAAEAETGPAGDAAAEKSSPASAEAEDETSLVSDISPSLDILTAQLAEVKKLLLQGFESIRKEIKALKK